MAKRTKRRSPEPPVDSDEATEDFELVRAPRSFSDRWWQKSGDDLAQSVWGIATWLIEDQKWRLEETRDILDLFDGRTLEGDSTEIGWQFKRGITGDDEAFRINVSKSASETVVADISGRQRPMCKFMTTGGTWKEKRRAKQLEKYVLGVMNQCHGQFRDGWAAMERIFADSTVLEFGVLRVFWDTTEKRVRIERMFPWEFYVDPVDAKHGEPLSLFRVFMMERDSAMWEFAENPELSLSGEDKMRRRMAIEQAPDVYKPSISPRTGAEQVARGVRVVEAWHRPVGTVPGKHVYVIGSVAMHEEEWNRRDNFGILRMRWEQDMIGWSGHSLVASNAHMAKELNFNAVKLQERFRLCGGKRTYYYTGTVDEKDMQANDAEVLVAVTPGQGMPQEVPPRPIGESEVMWMNIAKENYYQISGVSQQSATSQKEPGLDSGVAIRTMRDMGAARFSVRAREYERSFIDLAKLIIQATEEAYDAGEKIPHPEGKPDFDYAEIRVPENTFKIQMTAASSLPNDLPGRLQQVSELMMMGVLDKEAYLALIDSPDLERETSYATAQRNYLEKTIDKMLDATESAGDERISPDPLLPDKISALSTVARAYFDALTDDAPEYNLDLLRQFMTDITVLIGIEMAGQAPPGGGPMNGPAAAAGQPGAGSAQPPQPMGSPAP